MSIGERRDQSRFLCADLVRVKWFESAGPDSEDSESGKTMNALLEDISALGACVQVDRPIPLNAPITLSIGETNLAGGVCYSVFRDYGYFVGIRFSKNTEWSSETAMPRHLTDLALLAERARG